MRTPIAFMLIMMFFAASAAHAAQTRAPKISAQEVRYFAGKVKQGSQITHVFEISNTGTAPLVIERLQPS